MQAPIYLFLRDAHQRAAVVRDLAQLRLPVRTFESGADLTLAAKQQRPALVLWDLDDAAPRGGGKRLAARLGSAVIGLTFERERVADEDDMVTLLLPYGRWRVAPIAQRMLRAPAAPAPVEDDDTIFSPRHRADTQRQARPDFLWDAGGVLDSEAPKPDISTQRRVRVLIASADDVLQHILRYQLESVRCDVSSTGDGVEALQSVRAESPDVLLLDLDLPFLNGFEMLEQLGLKHSAAGPRPRVIIMSEQMHDDKVVRAFDLGADDFVHKPVNPRVIASRILRLVRGA